MHARAKMAHVRNRGQDPRLVHVRNRGHKIEKSGTYGTELAILLSTMTTRTKKTGTKNQEDKMTLSANDTRPATKRQTWALFCLTKKDHRDMGLTIYEASQLISKLKAEGNGTTPKTTARKKKTRKKKVSTASMLPRVDDENVLVHPEQIHARAFAAGMEALNACKPTPMTVQQRANPLNDNSQVVQQWHVAGGVCGFAWVNVPAKGAGLKFINGLKKVGMAGGVNSHRAAWNKDSYYKGYTYWVREGGQSMEMKEAFAHAFTSVLREYGIDARSMSRMD